MLLRLSLLLVLLILLLLVLLLLLLLLFQIQTDDPPRLAGLFQQYTPYFNADGEDNSLALSNGVVQ